MQSDDEIKRGWHKAGQLCLILIVYSGCGALMNLVLASDPSADDVAKGASIAGGMRMLGYAGAAVEGWVSRTFRTFAE